MARSCSSRTAETTVKGYLSGGGARAIIATWIWKENPLKGTLNADCSEIDWMNGKASGSERTELHASRLLDQAEAVKRAPQRAARTISPVFPRAGAPPASRRFQKLLPLKRA